MVARQQPTIVLEANCYEDPAKGDVWASVWFCPNGHDHNIELAEQESVVKVVGPVQFPIAVQVQEALVAILKSLGVEAASEAIADD